MVDGPITSVKLFTLSSTNSPMAGMYVVNRKERHTLMFLCFQVRKAWMCLIAPISLLHLL